MLCLRQLFKKNFKYIQINFLPQFSWGLLVVHRGCILLIHGPFVPQTIQGCCSLQIMPFCSMDLTTVQQVFSWLLISLVFLILQLKYSFLGLSRHHCQTQVLHHLPCYSLVFPLGLFHVWHLPRTPMTWICYQLIHALSSFCF